MLPEESDTIRKRFRSWSLSSDDLSHGAMSHGSDVLHTEESDTIAESDGEYSPPPPEDAATPDVGLVYEFGSVKGSVRKKRIKFTDVEKEAIRKGVKVHGVHSWSKVKEDSQGALERRTPQQIRDCYRTMKSNGMVDFDDLSPSISDKNLSVSETWI